jgi:hypothetical protein
MSWAKCAMNKRGQDSRVVFTDNAGQRPRYSGQNLDGLFGAHITRRPPGWTEGTAWADRLSRYWIGCTRTGSPHQAQVCDGRHWSALDTSTSRFVVDSGVPRFTE